MSLVQLLFWFFSFLSFFSGGTFAQQTNGTMSVPTSSDKDVQPGGPYENEPSEFVPAKYVQGCSPGKKEKLFKD